MRAAAFPRSAIIAALAALALAALGPAARSQAPLRLALIIGNTAYSTVAHPPLPNATHDADDVAAQLRDLGFQSENIEIEHDVKLADLGAILRRFGQRLRAAGPGTISFVYYSGHAGQDDQGLNYLIPVDSRAATPDALRNEGVPLQSLFADMTESGNPVNIIILDACRDWFKDAPQDVAPARGLHDMGPHGNVFVGMATTPGETVPDGVGAHSYYAKHLLEVLKERPNEPIALLFDDINFLVKDDSDDEQHPEYLNNLGARRWCFVSGPLCGEIPTHPLMSGATSLASELPEGMLNRQRLLTFTHDNVSFVETLLRRSDILERFEINTPLRFAHFLAAMAFEDERFRSHSENLRFSADSLYHVWGSRFASREEAESFAGQPERIANRIYANRIGNGDEASGDGWRYRGRGLFMLSGRANYARMAHDIEVDLVAAPDLLTDPENDLAAAGAFWDRVHANVRADADDAAGVGHLIDGGYGIQNERRLRILAAAKRAAGLTE